MYRLRWQKVELKWTKRHYLLALAFLFPPFHEFGHVVICYLTGATIYKVDWWNYVHHSGNTNIFHFSWEFTPLISILFSVLFYYYNMRNVKWQNGNYLNKEVQN